MLSVGRQARGQAVARNLVVSTPRTVLVVLGPLNVGIWA